MGWISDIFDGEGSPDGRAVREDPVERARQLRRGVGRAAAALEEEHPGLARSADEAAGDLVARLPDDAGEDLAREAEERLGRLHFALLQVGVARLTPGDVDAEEDVAAVRELAERAPGRPPPEADAGGGDAAAAASGEPAGR